MTEFDDFHEDLYLGDEEQPAILEFEYSRIVTTKTDKLVFVFPDGKRKEFNAEDCDYDSGRKVIMISEKTAMRRGFV